MSKFNSTKVLREKARILKAPLLPQRAPHVVDRSFEMPRALYAATVGLYFAFLAVMAAGMSSEGLVIPMAIFTIFIVAGFGVPALWTRLKPDNAIRAKSMSEFSRGGIMTHTGRLAPRDAAIQMLILPVLILVWGVAVVTIAAAV